MSSNIVSDAGATSIAEAFKVNKNLTNLHLSSNGVSDASATFRNGIPRQIYLGW